jgi:ApaG protein
MRDKSGMAEEGPRQASGGQAANPYFTATGTGGSSARGRGACASGCGRGPHRSECETGGQQLAAPRPAPRRTPTESYTTMSQYQFSVSAQTRYLPEQSNPERRQYAFAYTLTIRNTGKVAAQLIARHWVITDSENRVQEVKGLGVVGHQPLLQPGEQFEYTSWAVIETPVGTMRGAYFCVAEDGERFDAPVPEFALQMPRTLH